MTSLSNEIVLTSSPDGPIIAYDASSGTTLAHFSGSRSPRRGLAVTGKSVIATSHVSSATGSGSIHLYNWWSSTPYDQLPMPEPVAPLANTSDGSYLFAGGLSGNLHTLVLPSGTIIRSFTAHSKPVSCLDINDDGSLLISGGEDGAIVVSTIFKVISNENSSNLILYHLSAHSAPVTSIRCSLGRFFSCSLDFTCKLWGLWDGKPLHTVIFPCAIWEVALDTMESVFYAAGSDGFVYTGALKFGSEKLVTLGEKHEGAIMSVAMANEGQILMSASEDGVVRVWDIKQGKVINILCGHEMVGISDLVVVVKGGAGDYCHGNGGNDPGFQNFGVSSIMELCRISPVGGERELEEVLNDVAKERSKAIDMLESAIGMYERLLQLILKEAKGGCSSSSKNEEKQKDDV